MDAHAASLIGAGIAAVALGGAGIGLGIFFGHYMYAAMPQLDPTLFAPQLVWFAISFVVLLLLMWRLALPKVGEVVVMREERVQGNLKKAEQLKGEAETTLAG